MNGYSKIGSSATATSHKSTRSIDFPKLIRKTTTHLQGANHEDEDNKEVKKKNKDADHQSQKELDEEGERFGVILGRSCSVSSSSGGTPHGFRAFSIRRSSSVSERYCRIHDQNMAMASESDHDEKKRRGGKMILKTCKRLLGFNSS